MVYKTETIEGISVLKIFQKNTIITDAKEFREILNSLLDDGKKKILLDLTMTEFMDSTFLGSLVSVLKRCALEKGDLRIVRHESESPVWTMFELTNMYKVFKIYDDLNTAIDSFSKE